jgi:outer membrane protein
MPCHPLDRRRSGLTCLTLAAALASPVSAQTPAAPGPTAVAASSAADGEGWHYLAGSVAISQPRYPGSADTRIDGFPLLLATRSRYFIGHMPGSGLPLGVGAFLLQGEGGRVGIALGAGLGKLRRESDSPRLRGLGDIDSTARVSLFASGSLPWLTARGHLSADIGGGDQGLEAALELVHTVRVTEALSLSAGPGLTWGDARNAQSSFGIDALQSARSGRPGFTAGGGLRTVHFSVGAEYRLSARWNLGAMLMAGSLQGDAARSPIAEAKAQTSGGVFAVCRW